MGQLLIVRNIFLKKKKTKTKANFYTKNLDTKFVEERNICSNDIKQANVFNFYHMLVSGKRK